MAEQKGERIRVRLQWIQILNTMEPRFVKKQGDFRFRAKVSTGGREQVTLLPEKGTWKMTDNPAWNKREMDKVLFEGEAGDDLLIELYGEEVDRLSRNERLELYRRKLTGSVQDWLGWYGPGEDIPENAAAPKSEEDPEMMGHWRLCYIVERA